MLPRASFVHALSALTGAILVGRLLGFAREVILAAQFGTSPAMDAYLLALYLPTILLSSLNTMMPSLLVPAVAEKGGVDGLSKSANQAINAFLNWVVLLCGGIWLAGHTFAPWLVSFMAPGFDLVRHELAVSLMRWTLPTLLLMAVGSCTQTVLNAAGRFTTAARSIPLANLAFIAGLLLLRERGIYAAAAASLFGAAVPVLLDLSGMVRRGWRYGLIVRLPAAGKFGLRGPLLWSTGAIIVSQVSLVVDGMYASGLPGGSIAALSYGGKLLVLLQGLAITPALTILFTTMAEMRSTGEGRTLHLATARGLRTLIIVWAPIALVFGMLSREVVSLLFERGAFTGGSSELTATVLTCYAVGFVSIGVRDMLNRLYYVNMDLRIPFLASLIQAVSNILFDALLVHRYGTAGLSLASALAWTLSAAFLLGRTYFWSSVREGYEWVRELWRCVPALGGITVTVFSLGSLWPHPVASWWLGTVRVGLVGTAGLAAYGLVLMALRDPDVDTFVRWVLDHSRARLASFMSKG